MEYTIVGIKHVEYTNKKGNLVQGIEAHLTYEKDNVEGVCVKNAWISKNVATGLVLGDVIRLAYEENSEKVSFVIKVTA